MFRSSTSAYFSLQNQLIAICGFVYPMHSLYLLLVMALNSGVRFFVDVTLCVSTPVKLKKSLAALIKIKMQRLILVDIAFG